MMRGVIQYRGREDDVLVSYRETANTLTRNHSRP